MKKESRFLVLTLAALALVFSLGFYVGKSAAPAAVTVQLARQTQSEDVAAPAADVPAAAAPAPETASTGEQIDLNTATKEQLMTLPGVGEVLAERILAYRQDVGRFVSVEQLMDVSGIGESKFEALKELVKVGE